MFYGENRSASIMMQEDNGFYGLWVQGQTSSVKGIWTNGETTINNDLTVTGAKSGFVVDIALNDGPVPLEKGDVVVISGVDAPVVGNIPVIRVQKAATANATNVMGVVDTRYVPCTDESQRLKGQACEGFDRSKTVIQPGEYLSVVTLGAYEAIKVDATVAPVHSGDLLAASATAGRAFAATPLSVQATSFYAPGTVVGVALADLNEGTGTIPVFVSPR
jgi:hypothetical protein